MGKLTTDFYVKSTDKKRTWFKSRQYPENLIDSEMRKVKFNIKETNKKNKSKNGVPSVVIYHPLLNYV